MKINKNGWGLIFELVFIGIFIICFIISVYALSKVGLVKEDFYLVKFVDSLIPDNNKNYVAVENQLINATKNYIKDNYDNEIESNMTIRSSQLISNNYIDELNYNCTGYVDVSLNNNYKDYKAYISCEKYKTKGYETGKDF